MTKLLSLAAVIGVSFFCVAATSAMPLAPLEQTEASLTIPVAGGCNGYYGGGYYGGAVAPGVAPGVVVTAPGVVVAPRAVGPSCRRCNAYRCWYVC